MPEPERTVGSPDDQTAIEAGILERLTESHDHRPWTIDELVRDIGVDLATRDAVSNLQRLGLIHLYGDLVFPSRAAIHAERLRQ